MSITQRCGTGPRATWSGPATRWIRFPFVCILALFSACQTGDPADETPTESPTPEATPAYPSFSADVQPLLEDCIRCHADGAGGWTYDGVTNAHASVYSEVNLEDPPSSTLLTKATGEDHAGGAFFDTSSDAYLTIIEWIEKGAQDN